MSEDPEGRPQVTFHRPACGSIKFQQSALLHRGHMQCNSLNTHVGLYGFQAHSISSGFRLFASRGNKNARGNPFGWFI